MLPLDRRTAAFETCPLGATVTVTSTEPRNAATEFGMSGGCGVITFAGAYGTLHAAATRAGPADSGNEDAEAGITEAGANA